MNPNPNQNSGQEPQTPILVLDEDTRPSNAGGSGSATPAKTSAALSVSPPPPPPPPPPDPSTTSRIQGWRDMLGASTDELRDWADRNLPRLRMATQVTAAVAVAMVVRKFYMWAPIKNSAGTAAELAATGKKMRVRCAGVVRMPHNRIVLRCQHVPILRHGFLDQKPVILENPSDFSSHAEDLLNVELFGLRTFDEIAFNDNVVEMLNRSLVDSVPRPNFKIRCLTPSPSFSVEEDTLLPQSAPSDADAQQSMGGSSPALFPGIQCTADINTRGMYFEQGNRRKGLLDRRDQATDKLAFASELGLSVFARLKLRVFGIYLNPDRLLPQWLRNLQADGPLNVHLVRNGLARVVTPEDIAYVTKPNHGGAATLDGEFVRGGSEDNRMAARIMDWLEAEEHEAQVCRRGSWAIVANGDAEDTSQSDALSKAASNAANKASEAARGVASAAGTAAAHVAGGAATAAKKGATGAAKTIGKGAAQVAGGAVKAATKGATGAAKTLGKGAAQVAGGAAVAASKGVASAAKTLGNSMFSFARKSAQKMQEKKDDSGKGANANTKSESEVSDNNELPSLSSSTPQQTNANNSQSILDLISPELKEQKQKHDGSSESK